MNDHLLRTLAAVPLGSRVLDLSGDDSRHAEALRLLGFEVRTPSGDTSTFPGAFFDWVVATDGLDEAHDLPVVLAEVLRVLAPGGWAFVSLPAERFGPEATPDDLTRLFERAGFALAEAPAEEEESGERRLRGIYRRVDEGTPV